MNLSNLRAPKKANSNKKRVAACPRPKSSLGCHPNNNIQLFLHDDNRESCL